jgi:hypothetical protein
VGRSITNIFSIVQVAQVGENFQENTTKRRKRNSLQNTLLHAFSQINGAPARFDTCCFIFKQKQPISEGIWSPCGSRKKNMVVSKMKAEFLSGRER